MRCLLLTLLLGMSELAIAQSDYLIEWVNPLPQGSSVEGIQQMDQDRIYAVTERGSFLKSTDGGQSWSSSRVSESLQLYHLHFLSLDTGFIVGDRKACFRTTDGGRTWAELDLSTPFEDYYQMLFVDDQTGFIFGQDGVVVKTTDRGDTWNAITVSTSEDINEGFFANANTGYFVCDDGLIFKSTNGGNSWTSQTSGITSDLYGLYFHSADSGFVVGRGGKLLRTTDGGTNWNEITTPTTKDLELIYFENSQHGIAAGDDGTIIETTNGGSSWSVISSGSSEDLLDYSVYDGNVMISGLVGTIIESDDLTNWSSVDSALTRADLFDIFFYNRDTAYIAGSEGTVLKSTDGGLSWSELNTSSSAKLNHVHFPTADVGYAVGGQLSSGTVLKTTNGGNSWAMVHTPNTELISCHFTSADTGYAVNDPFFDSLRIYKTVDGGANWEAYNTGLYNVDGYEITFPTSQVGYVSAEDGYLFKTTNAGATWVQVDVMGSDYRFYDMQFLDQDTGYIAAERGHIYTTYDGGDSWTSQSFGLTNMSAVHFVNSERGFYLQAIRSGFSSATHRFGITENSGGNWESKSIFANGWWDLWAPDSLNAYMVGWNGKILRFQKQDTSNLAPTALTLSADSVRENLPAGTFVGLFEGTDPDDDPLNYALVGGNGDEDNARFVVRADSLFTDQVFDHEEISEASIRVSAADPALERFEATFTIRIGNQNETPFELILVGDSVDEALPPGQFVGRLTCQDPDGDTLAFGFTPDALPDTAAFRISQDSLFTAQTLDYETNTSYVLSITATDPGGLSTAEVFIIRIKEVNEPPILLTLSNDTILEQTPAGSFVGQLAAADPDDSELSFALTSGEGDQGNASFRISGDSLLSDQSFVFADQNSYSIRVQVADPRGGVLDTTFQIEVTELPQTVGLEALPESFGVRAYPNPASEQLHLSFDAWWHGKTVALRLVDMQGKTHLAQTYHPSGQPLQLNTSALAAGMYRLLIISQGQFTTLPLLKQ